MRSHVDINWSFGGLGRARYRSGAFGSGVGALGSRRLWSAVCLGVGFSFWRPPSICLLRRLRLRDLFLSRWLCWATRYL